MAQETFWSVAAGVLIGVVYGIAGLTMSRRARTARRERFMPIVLGGMAVRIFVSLTLVALIVLLTGVEQSAFLGSFLFVFIAGLTVEVAVLHRSSVVPIAQDPIDDAQAQDPERIP